MHVNIYIVHTLFRSFSITCFGRHSSHPQGGAVIQEYKNTNVVNWVTITPKQLILLIRFKFLK